MPDHKKMYLEMVRGTEKAINVLIDVQQKCEEMYISSPEAEITVLPSGEIHTDDAEAETAPVS